MTKRQKIRRMKKSTVFERIDLTIASEKKPSLENGALLEDYGREEHKVGQKFETVMAVEPQPWEKHVPWKILGE